MNLNKIAILPKKETDIITSCISSTFTPTGNFYKDKKRAEKYAEVFKMDTANTKVAITMATQGPDAAAKAMISEFTDSSGNFDYCAMRSRYG